MANSSPEYAITKPGVQALSRKRDRPLRTYGRQPVALPEPRSEPLAKRPRVVYAVDGDDGHKNTKPLVSVPASNYSAPAVAVADIVRAKRKLCDFEDQENQPSLPELSMMPAAAAKRSILNYFKPAVEGAARPAVTNVSRGGSKLVLEQQKGAAVQPAARPKTRLLRIRSDQPTDSVEEKEEEEKKKKKREDRCADAAEEKRGGMRGTAAAGRKRKSWGSGGGTGAAEPRRVRQKSTPAEVQTTLNISNRAAFSECRVCDTVWNPLYPDDVKYHTKRHAAHLRARRKSEDDGF